ncbi:unnamed protein product [Clonostachys byssicola]|uniref:Major facilitator superfamily (MFS) profile domain-containing protein n=1 Tax=Clonostachys byssicola TaxID=160290 RepID=A0A9N9UG43_9HYPO|nr:unnamed protein product [Clonostachys byssicola]
MEDKPAPVMDIDRKDSNSKSEEPGLVEPIMSPEEERSTLRNWYQTYDRTRLDFFLMPLLVSGFFVLQLDRSNIGNALTDTLTTDLGITTDDVNLGNQLMLIGIIVAEIPSNLILQKIGAPVWLTLQMFIWGLIALTQAWCTGINSFYATRFLLGVFEGGYIPGGQYMLALFYTRKELALRTAIFYFGNYSATATGSLIAAGILNMGGLRGLSGWQWLFISDETTNEPMVEGALTLLIFLGFVALLPHSPERTAPIHGRWDFFSERERQFMSIRVVAEDDSKSAHKAKISFASLGEALLDYRLWLHMILNVASLAPKGGLQLYGPLVIRSLGFSKTDANLLNAVSSVLVIILSWIISIASDRTKLRGPWCIVALLWSVIFAGALFAKTTDPDKWLRYALFTLLSGGNALTQGLNDAWLSINATSASKRSIGLAMVVIGSNLGGLAGQQLFRSSDAPKYSQAFLAILLLYAASIPITLVIMWVYWRDNKKGRAARVDETENSISERKFDI